MFIEPHSLSPIGKIILDNIHRMDEKPPKDTESAMLNCVHPDFRKYAYDYNPKPGRVILTNFGTRYSNGSFRYMGENNHYNAMAFFKFISGLPDIDEKVVEPHGENWGEMGRVGYVNKRLELEGKTYRVFVHMEEYGDDSPAGLVRQLETHTIGSPESGYYSVSIHPMESHGFDQEHRLAQLNFSAHLREHRTQIDIENNTKVGNKEDVARIARFFFSKKSNPYTPPEDENTIEQKPRKKLPKK